MSQALKDKILNLPKKQNYKHHPIEYSTGLFPENQQNGLWVGAIKGGIFTGGIKYSKCEPDLPLIPVEPRFIVTYLIHVKIQWSVYKEGFPLNPKVKEDSFCWHFIANVWYHYCSGTRWIKGEIPSIPETFGITITYTGTNGNNNPAQVLEQLKEAYDTGVLLLTSTIELETLYAPPSFIPTEPPPIPIWRPYSLEYEMHLKKKVTGSWEQISLWIEDSGEPEPLEYEIDMGRYTCSDCID